MSDERIKFLDEHRLMCADATDKKAVNELLDGEEVGLLLTDPPYGIDIVNTTGGTNRRSETTNIQQGTVGTPAKPGFKKKTRVGGVLSMVKSEDPGIVEPRIYKPVIGDDKPFDPQHLLDLDCPSIIFGANNFASKLPDNNKWIVWYKKPSLESKRNHFSDCELAWTNLKGKAIFSYHHTWSGMVRKGERRLELKERIHPTQKPVGLLKRLIEEYSEPNDIILDLYGGSGSTLIACAETNRRCRIMELSNDYCDLIIDRYNNYKDSSQTRLSCKGNVTWRE